MPPLRQLPGESLALIKRSGGLADGIRLGMAELLGATEGVELGSTEGITLTEGTGLSSLDGIRLGIDDLLGASEGIELDTTVGTIDGAEVLRIACKVQNLLPFELQLSICTISFTLLAQWV